MISSGGSEPGDGGSEQPSERSSSATTTHVEIRIEAGSHSPSPTRCGWVRPLSDYGSLARSCVGADETDESPGLHDRPPRCHEGVLGTTVVIAAGSPEDGLLVNLGDLLEGVDQRPLALHRTPRRAAHRFWAIVRARRRAPTAPRVSDRPPRSPMVPTTERRCRHRGPRRVHLRRRAGEVPAHHGRRPEVVHRPPTCDAQYMMGHRGPTGKGILDDRRRRTARVPRTRSAGARQRRPCGRCTPRQGDRDVKQERWMDLW